MICESIDLYAYFQWERGGAKRGFLHSYRHEINAEMAPRLRPAMLIFPGGGYEFVSLREWESVVLCYFQEGFDAFVLEYDVAPVGCYPAVLEQAGMAMLYLRREARHLSLREDKIAAIGFSAGGHLAGCISFLWDDPALMRRFGAECEKIKPDLCILSYPVVSADPQYCHSVSFDHFCAGMKDRSPYSLENRVRSFAPPCFIWATSDDTCVLVENSIRLYSALCRAGVPTEFHAFEHGVHGMSVCNRDVTEHMSFETEHVARWVDLSKEFLNAHDFIPVTLRQRSE